MAEVARSTAVPTATAVGVTTAKAASVVMVGKGPLGATAGAESKAQKGWRHRFHRGEMILTLKCQCRNVTGTADTSGNGLRLTCCCDDCQTFAAFLDREDLPDEYGGTEVLQVPTAHLKITKGLEHLRCVRLTSSGLFRWYAGCCNTPIGNVLPGSLPFVGLHTTFIEDWASLEAEVGSSMAYVQIKWATARIPDELNPRKVPAKVIALSARNLLLWKIKGLGRPSPFLNSNDELIAEPVVLH